MSVFLGCHFLRLPNPRPTSNPHPLMVPYFLEPYFKVPWFPPLPVNKRTNERFRSHFVRPVAARARNFDDNVPLLNTFHEYHRWGLIMDEMKVQLGRAPTPEVR